MNDNIIYGSAIFSMIICTLTIGHLTMFAIPAWHEHSAELESELDPAYYSFVEFLIFSGSILTIISVSGTALLLAFTSHGERDKS